MHFKRKLYFSPFGKIISFIQNTLSVFSRPFMVYGYKRKTDGKYLKNSRISSSVILLNPEKFKMEDNVWVWHYTVVDASNGVTIEEGCQIGAWVGIFTHSSHAAIRLNGENYIQIPIDHRVGYIKGSVLIGAYTFIGAKSIIMPGTIIGKGCVIGAGSIVKGNFPDYSIIVGNPAKIVGDTRTTDAKLYKEGLSFENYYDKNLIKDFSIVNVK